MRNTSPNPELDAPHNDWLSTEPPFLKQHLCPTFNAPRRHASPSRTPGSRFFAERVASPPRRWTVRTDKPQRPRRPGPMFPLGGSILMRKTVLVLLTALMVASACAMTSIWNRVPVSLPIPCFSTVRR